MKRILVISDVHGDFEKVREILESEIFDFSVFCGDWEINEIHYSKLFDYYVRGNNDYNDNLIKNNEYFSIEGVNFFLTHGHFYSNFLHKIKENKLMEIAQKYNAQLIMFGHTHIKQNKTIENKYGEKVILLNPGSISSPRDGNKGSYAIVKVSDGTILSIRFINC